MDSELLITLVNGAVTAITTRLQSKSYKACFPSCTCFPELNAVRMFSRAYHRLHVFLAGSRLWPPTRVSGVRILAASSLVREATKHAPASSLIGLLNVLPAEVKNHSISRSHVNVYQVTFFHSFLPAPATIYRFSIYLCLSITVCCLFSC